MLERINLILKSRNLNAAQFADEIGVQRSSVSHILTGRNKASLDFLLKVLTRYPEIDTDWLLTGKGKMIHSVSVKPEQAAELKQKEFFNLNQGNILEKSNENILYQETDIQYNKNDNLDNVKEVSSENIKQTETGMGKTEEQKKPEERVSITPSARHIEKIVIFYTDKTFSLFNPED